MKFNKRKFKNLDASEIGRMKVPELRELLRGARNAYQAQQETFKKYKSTVWSPALEKIEDYYEDKGQKSVSKMNRNQALSELMHLQEFFNARTSTVPGARKVAIEQDIRLFGLSEKGKPAKRLSLDERTAMWKNYKKFIALHPNMANLLEGGSDRIQQYFAQAQKDRPGDMTVSDLEAAFQDLMNEYHNQDWEWGDYEDEEPEILSGTRPY